MTSKETFDVTLENLRKVSIKLQSHEVHDYFEKQDKNTFASYISLRNETSIAVDKMSNARLQGISKKLDELYPEIIEGISNLNSKLEKLETAIEILNILTGILGLVGRVISFAI